MDAAWARGFKGFGLPLAGWFKGFRGWWWRLTPQIIKKGRGSAAVVQKGCVRFAQGATALRAEGGGALRAMSFISRLRRSRQHRVSILSAYLVHPFPLRGTSPQGETRDMTKKQRVIYFRYHFGVFPLWWLTPPPFPRKRGHYKAPLCCELLMKGLLFRALFCPLHRGKFGRAG